VNKDGPPRHLSDNIVIIEREIMDNRRERNRFMKGLMSWTGFRVTNLEVLGFITLSVSIFFMGGIQLICLGVLGEYLGKIYLEVKGRPKYFVDSI